MKTYAGYINLKAINGVIFPSYAQNQMNKDFIINKLNGQFFLATNENTYGSNNIVLVSLLKEKNIDGVVMLSVFSLPNSFNERKNIYKICQKNKKKIFFNFENIELITNKDIEKIEEYLIFNNKFFTRKKSSITKFEKQIFDDPSWTLV
jgi:sporadic carbohydrate cluster protein (TIGR04323 family)